jgi:hypothetical protein
MTDVNRLPRRRFLGVATAALLAGCRAADVSQPTGAPATVVPAAPTQSSEPSATAVRTPTSVSAADVATVATAIPATDVPAPPTAAPTQPPPPTRAPPAGPIAPEIRSETWINSAPLNWGELRGRVVMVEFWTYG